MHLTIAKCHFSMSKVPLFDMKSAILQIEKRRFENP